MVFDGWHAGEANGPGQRRGGKYLVVHLIMQNQVHRRIKGRPQTQHGEANRRLELRRFMRSCYIPKEAMSAIEA